MRLLAIVFVGACLAGVLGQRAHGADTPGDDFTVGDSRGARSTEPLLRNSLRLRGEPVVWGPV